MKKLMGAVETYAGSILDELTDNVIDTSEEEVYWEGGGRKDLGLQQLNPD